MNTLSVVKVDRPRTAYSHTNCVTHSNTGIEGLDGKLTLKTVYKTLCHAPCYLKGIKVDDIGSAGLKGCWTMNGNDTCMVCGRSWMSHLHINYELEEGTQRDQ